MGLSSCQRGVRLTSHDARSAQRTAATRTRPLRLRPPESGLRHTPTLLCARALLEPLQCADRLLVLLLLLAATACCREPAKHARRHRLFLDAGAVVVLVVLATLVLISQLNLLRVGCCVVVLSARVVQGGGTAECELFAPMGGRGCHTRTPPNAHLPPSPAPQTNKQTRTCRAALLLLLASCRRRCCLGLVALALLDDAGRHKAREARAVVHLLLLLLLGRSLERRHAVAGCCCCCCRLRGRHVCCHLRR